MEWAAACSEYHDSTSQGKDFKQEVLVAVQAKNGDIAPVWQPSSAVVSQMLQGTMVFYDIGFLQDSDLVGLTKLTMAAHKIKPTVIRNEIGGGSSKGIFISLRSVPLDLIHTIRKIRVFSTLQIVHDEGILDPARQLSQSQGFHTFSFAADEEQKRRCDPLRPLGRWRLPSIKELQDKALVIIAQRESNEAAVATADQGEDGYAEESSEESCEGSEQCDEALPTRNKAAARISLGTALESIAVKKKQTKPGNRARSRSRSPAGSASCSATAAIGGLPDVVGDEMAAFEALDPEMALIAKKFCGGRIGSLNSLSVQRVLAGGRIGRSLEGEMLLVILDRRCVYNLAA
jgi:hypothetical protein